MIAPDKYTNCEEMDVSMFSMESDKNACIALRDQLKECDFLADATLLVTNIIAQFALGKVILCDCKSNEILLLPSLEEKFKRYQCSDCNDGSCSNIQCESCNKQSNTWSWSDRKNEEPNSFLTCSTCETYKEDFNPKCINCLFICKGCCEYYCTRLHRECICKKCGAEFCSKGEAKFKICQGCNQIVCHFCNLIKYKFNGVTQWIPCGEFFNVCNTCLNLQILDQYQTDTQIQCCKACHETLTQLQRNGMLKIFPTKVLVLLVIYSHDCVLNDCESL